MRDDVVAVAWIGRRAIRCAVTNGVYDVGDRRLGPAARASWFALRDERFDDRRVEARGGATRGQRTGAAGRVKREPRRGVRAAARARVTVGDGSERGGSAGLRASETGASANSTATGEPAICSIRVWMRWPNRSRTHCSTKRFGARRRTCASTCSQCSGRIHVANCWGESSFWNVARQPPWRNRVERDGVFPRETRRADLGRTLLSERARLSKTSLPPPSVAHLDGAARVSNEIGPMRAVDVRCDAPGRGK